MQFPYGECVVNLLDTPGHEDFSEDTYRTLTAVDSALMVIDCAKGVEERTIKLMEVCRLRDTPIMTFINKLDRDGREPVDLLDEIERVLGLRCAPVTWPIGMGRELKGIYHLLEDRIYVYEAAARGRAGMGPYTASKAGVERLSESLADELKDRNITVNTILPGTIDTPANRADMPDADTTRWVQPDEVADVVVFLASDAARAVTGAAIRVFGRG